MSQQSRQYGVGKYLLFAQTWTVVPSITVVVITGLVFRYLVNELRVSPAYGAEALVLMVLVVAVAWRFVRGAILIRHAYQDLLRDKGTTWSEIQATHPPPDPTASFIGRHWWRLPAVVLGFLGVLWGLLEAFGLSELIRRTVVGHG